MGRSECVWNLDSNLSPVIFRLAKLHALRANADSLSGRSKPCNPPCFLWKENAVTAAMSAVLWYLCRWRYCSHHFNGEESYTGKRTLVAVGQCSWQWCVGESLAPSQSSCGRNAFVASKSIDTVCIATRWGNITRWAKLQEWLWGGTGNAQCRLLGGGAGDFLPSENLAMKGAICKPTGAVK